MPLERYDTSDLLETWERLGGDLQAYMRDPTARSAILKEVVQTHSYPDSGPRRSAEWQPHSVNGAATATSF